MHARTCAYSQAYPALRVIISSFFCSTTCTPRSDYCNTTVVLLCATDTDKKELNMKALKSGILKTLLKSGPKGKIAVICLFVFVQRQGGYIFNHKLFARMFLYQGTKE